MPTGKPYELEHYPPAYVTALRQAIASPGQATVFAREVSSKAAATTHRRFAAMLKGLQTFSGQDGQLEAAARGSRLSIKKIWMPAEKQVQLTVTYAERPSEVAAAWLASLSGNN